MFVSVSDCVYFRLFSTFLSFFISRSQPTNQPTSKHCCYWNESDEEKTNKTHDCFSALCKNLTQFTFFKMLRSHKTKMQFHKIYVCCSAPLWNRRSVQWNDDDDVQFVVRRANTHKEHIEQVWMDGELARHKHTRRTHNEMRAREKTRKKGMC